MCERGFLSALHYSCAPFWGRHTHIHMFRNSLCSLSHDNKSSQNVCTQLISADLQTCAAAPLASYKLIAMAFVRRHLWEDDAGARPGGDHAWERDDDAASESELEDEGEGTQKWAAARFWTSWSRSI